LAETLPVIDLSASSSSGQSQGSCWIDPIGDPRWSRLLEKHPEATVFHTPEWLEALRRTYNYQPIAVTSTPPGPELVNGWVFCDVKSWLTGRRLVSLPFSDHCDPLVGRKEDVAELLTALATSFSHGLWRNVQVRPKQDLYFGSKAHPPIFLHRQSYFLHKLDLRPTLDEIYQRFDKDSIQRKIRRAERERLECQEGRSTAMIDQFYRLFVSTRRRHHLPPQPKNWFQTLMACMGERAKMRVCYKDGKPIAGMVTLTYKQVVIYKYGCSNAQFHNLGAMPYLFWRVIQEAKQTGIELDLGRCDRENVGLARFKQNLGGKCSRMDYWSYSAIAASKILANTQSHASKWFFRCMPDSCLTAAGNILYKHMG
jgi:hypothetical protein